MKYGADIKAIVKRLEVGEADSVVAIIAIVNNGFQFGIVVNPNAPLMEKLTEACRDSREVTIRATLLL